MACKFFVPGQEYYKDRDPVPQTVKAAAAEYSCYFFGSSARGCGFKFANTDRSCCLVPGHEPANLHVETNFGKPTMWVLMPKETK